MGNVYSTLAFRGTLPAGAGDLYTVPLGFVFVVVDIELTTVYDDSLPHHPVVAVTGPAGNIIAILDTIHGGGAETPLGLSYKHRQWQGRQVLNPGDVISYTNSSAPQAPYLSITGYLLELP